MDAKNPIVKRTPTRYRVRASHERCPFTLTPAAKRALLLEQLRAGISTKLTQEN